MKRLGELVFLGAIALAVTLYWATAPNGLPWNASSQLSLAYLDEVVRFPSMPHPVWGYYVGIFGGAVGLAIACASLAAGLLGWLVNRYFGWRAAFGAALVWIFLPGVWNRVITGERGICLASMCVVALWMLNAAVLRVTRKARAMRKTGGVALADRILPGSGQETKRGKAGRIVAWSMLGAAGLFAIVSLTLHDYRIGEVASAFARGVIESAGERVIVMNGVCDDQVVREIGVGVEGRCRCRGEEKSDSAGQHNMKSDVHSTPTSTPTLYTLSLRNDDAYRSNLVAWVRSAFPTETNLWVAAQVGPRAFLDAALVRHVERFYFMNGESTTSEDWQKRWAAFQPYLKSSDPFVRVARRHFGHEGNAVANAICDGVAGVENRCRCREDGKVCSADRRTIDETVQSTPTPNTYTSSAALAWQMYKRIYEEVDPGNISALANMDEMIRRGYKVSGDEKRKLQDRIEAFMKDAYHRQHLREILRAAGPVRSDPDRLAKMAEEVRKRIAARVAAGEKIETPPEVLSLMEWNSEMMHTMEAGDLAKAGRIARKILSNKRWRGFIPANVVMGTLMSSEGDYEASVAFFKVATATTNKVADVVLNDYADALLRLGRLDEAEKFARRAIAESKGKMWLAHITLAQTLGRRLLLGGAKMTEAECRKCEKEMRELFREASRTAPKAMQDKIRAYRKDCGL